MIGDTDSTLFENLDRQVLYFSVWIDFFNDPFREPRSSGSPHPLISTLFLRPFCGPMTVKRAISRRPINAYMKRLFSIYFYRYYREPCSPGSQRSGLFRPFSRTSIARFSILVFGSTFSTTFIENLDRRVLHSSVWIDLFNDLYREPRSSGSLF